MVVSLQQNYRVPTSASLSIGVPWKQLVSVLKTDSMVPPIAFFEQLNVLEDCCTYIWYDLMLIVGGRIRGISSKQGSPGGRGHTSAIE